MNDKYLKLDVQFRMDFYLKLSQRVVISSFILSKYQ